jgi:hypothetical protein
LIDDHDSQFHAEVRISKRILSRLPSTFVTVPEYLGDQKDALRQYRGPNNLHVLEYPDDWSFHRDYSDPRTDPLGHLLSDAPEPLLCGLVSLFVGLAVYGETRSVIEGSVAGAAAGLFARGVLSALKRLAESNTQPLTRKLYWR